MLIKDFLGLGVLDTNAKKIGKVSNVDFNTETGAIETIYISLDSGIFSKNQVEIDFNDINTIGDYLLLANELPEEEEESEVEVEVEE